MELGSPGEDFGRVGRRFATLIARELATLAHGASQSPREFAAATLTVRTRDIYPLSDAQVTAVVAGTQWSPSGKAALARESGSAIHGDGWSPARPWDEAERVADRIGVDIFTVEFPCPEGQCAGAG